MATPPNHIRFHAYLPPDVYEKLQRLAESEDRSMSAVLRQAIEERAARREAVDV